MIGPLSVTDTVAPPPSLRVRTSICPSALYCAAFSIRFEISRSIQVAVADRRGRFELGAAAADRADRALLASGQSALGERGQVEPLMAVETSLARSERQQRLQQPLLLDVGGEQLLTGLAQLVRVRVRVCQSDLQQRALQRQRCAQLV